MKKPIVIIGLGEMGGVFARGFLRTGYPVYPALRDTDLCKMAEDLPEPEMVLVAVGEKDLHPILDALPDPWRDRLTLLQNELLPRDWQPYGLEPTVISVWFEKKRGQDAKVLVPSPVYGRHADLIAEALGSLDIPSEVLDGSERLLFELVRKNLYIVTTNVAGLRSGGTVDELRRQNTQLMQDVAGEILAIQEYLTGEKLPARELTEAMLVAFDGDPDHGCMGRSAPTRLERALAQAGKAGLAVPTLEGIAAETR